MLKCKICGTEFPAIKEHRYTGTGSVSTLALSPLLEKEERKIYDSAIWITGGWKIESVRISCNLGGNMKFLKMLFCKHDYEYEYLHKVHGGMAKLYRCNCKKCGKVVYKT